jgi:signal recognition particle subunit SRP54
MGGMMQAAQDPAAMKQMKHMEALIDSMTVKERRNPDIIKGSRKKRIAAGAGLEIQDLNRLMKQQKMMAKMMKKMRTKGGMKNMMRGLEGMMGGNGGPGGSGGMGGPGGGMPPGGMGGGMPPM